MSEEDLKNFRTRRKTNHVEQSDQNTIAKHPYEKRNALTTDKLLPEIRAFTQTVVIVYCVREGAADFHNGLKMLRFPIRHVVKNLDSTSTRKDIFQHNGYKKNIEIVPWLRILWSLL